MCFRAELAECVHVDEYPSGFRFISKMSTDEHPPLHSLVCPAQLFMLFLSKVPA